jgi:hypothetical protein
MVFQTMKFLMKNRVKYFNSFFTISSAIPIFFGTKMISTKSSINGGSFTHFEDTFVNSDRISVESPGVLYDLCIVSKLQYDSRKTSLRLSMTN